MVQQIKRQDGKRKSATEQAGVTMEHEGEFVRIVIPVRFKRRSGRKEIIPPPGADHAPPAPRPQAASAQDAVAAALGRAHRWQEMLDAGQVDSVAALARRLNLEKSNLARNLRLTALAPDIVDALLDGNEPDGLPLTRLYRVTSHLWGEQREELGFAGR